MRDNFAILFQETQQGNRFAQNAFYGMTFRRLRSIASMLLQKERAGHTLQATALVSELFLKLRGLGTQILGEEHFFRVAARLMRHILVDYARRHAAVKRNHGAAFASLDGTIAVSANQSAEALAID